MAGVRGRSGSGGRRPGAGRKPKAEQFAKEITAAEKEIAGQLSTLLQQLFQLASGGYERVSSQYEAAALVVREEAQDIMDQEGQPTGKMRRTKVQAFPDLPPEQMVLVKQTRSVADADRAAVVYLIDRILGRPSGEDESERVLGIIATFKETVLTALGEENDELRQRVITRLKRR